MPCGPRFLNFVFIHCRWLCWIFSGIALLVSCLWKTVDCRLYILLLSFFFAGVGIPFAFAGIPDVKLIRISSQGEYGPVYLTVRAKKLNENELAVGPLTHNGSKKAFCFRITDDGVIAYLQHYNSELGLDIVNVIVDDLACMYFKRKSEAIGGSLTGAGNCSVSEGQEENTNQIYQLYLLKDYNQSDQNNIANQTASFEDITVTAPLKIIREGREEAFTLDFGLAMTLLLAEAERAPIDSLVAEFNKLTVHKKENDQLSHLSQVFRHIPKGEAPDVNTDGVASLSSLYVPHKETEKGKVSLLSLDSARLGEIVNLITYPNMPENGAIIGPFGLSRDRDDQDSTVQYVIYMTQPETNSIQFELLEDSEETVEHSVWNNRKKGVRVVAYANGGFSISVEGQELISDQKTNIFDQDCDFIKFTDNVEELLTRMVNFDYLLFLMSYLEKEAAKLNPYNHMVDYLKTMIKDVFIKNKNKMKKGYLADSAGVVFDRVSSKEFYLWFYDGSVIPMQAIYSTCSSTGMVFGTNIRNNSTFYIVSLKPGVKQDTYTASRMEVANIREAWKRSYMRRIFGVMGGGITMSFEHSKKGKHVVTVTENGKELRRCEKRITGKDDKKFILYGTKQSENEILPDLGAIYELLEAESSNAASHIDAGELFLTDFELGLQSTHQNSQVTRENLVTHLERVLTTTETSIKSASIAFASSDIALKRTSRAIVSLSRDRLRAAKTLLRDTSVIVFNTVGETLKIAASQPKISSALLIGAAASAYYAGYADLKTLQTVIEPWVLYLSGNGSRIIEDDCIDGDSATTSTILIPPTSKPEKN